MEKGKIAEERDFFDNYDFMMQDKYRHRENNFRSMEYFHL